MITWLTADLVGIGILSGVIVALLVLVELASRLWRIRAEWTRKAAHVSSGIALLAGQALVHDSRSMALAGLGFAALLLLARRLGLLRSVHGVGRRTEGAILFPIAVVLLHAFAGGDALRYVVPLLVLTLADTAAAVVGERFGRCEYRILDARRTLEGSAAFVLTALVVTWAGLTWAGMGEPAARPLIALCVALVACTLEAISVRGFDNVSVPLGSFGALQLMLAAPGDGAAELGASALVALLSMGGAAAAAWFGLQASARAQGGEA